MKQYRVTVAEIDTPNLSDAERELLQTGRDTRDSKIETIRYSQTLDALPDLNTLAAALNPKPKRVRRKPEEKTS